MFKAVLRTALQRDTGSVFPFRLISAEAVNKPPPELIRAGTFSRLCFYFAAKKQQNRFIVRIEPVEGVVCGLITETPVVTKRNKLAIKVFTRTKNV